MNLHMPYTVAKLEMDRKQSRKLEPEEEEEDK
jgi:hypothetical protein